MPQSIPHAHSLPLHFPFLHFLAKGGRRVGSGSGGGRPHRSSTPLAIAAYQAQDIVLRARMHAFRAQRMRNNHCYVAFITNHARAKNPCHACNISLMTGLRIDASSLSSLTGCIRGVIRRAVARCCAPYGPPCRRRSPWLAGKGRPSFLEGFLPYGAIGVCLRFDRPGRGELAAAVCIRRLVLGAWLVRH